MALDIESFDILLPAIQRFVLERLVPAENYLEEHDEVPADIIEDMKEMGLCCSSRRSGRRASA